MIEIKVEWVLRIHINEDQVCVIHRQLPKPQAIARIRHVIAAIQYPLPRSCVSKYLNNAIASEPNLSDLSLDVRRRQHLFWIDYQIIFIYADSRNFVRHDQPCDADTEQIHESFDREVQRFDVLRMYANSAVLCRRKLAFHLERGIDLHRLNDPMIFPWILRGSSFGDQQWDRLSRSAGLPHLSCRVDMTRDGSAHNCRREIQ